MLRLLFPAALALLLSACGGYTITRTSAPISAPIKTVATSPMDGNSPEVDGYVRAAMRSSGLTPTASIAQDMHRTDKADAVLTYLDVWRWDFATYMRSIDISIYDAKSGDLLVKGRWKDSFFHTWQRGKVQSQELLKQMMEKLKS